MCTKRGVQRLTQLSQYKNKTFMLYTNLLFFFICTLKGNAKISTADPAHLAGKRLRRQQAPRLAHNPRKDALPRAQRGAPCPLHAVYHVGAHQSHRGPHRSLGPQAEGGHAVLHGH